MMTAVPSPSNSPTSLLDNVAASVVALSRPRPDVHDEVRQVTCVRTVLGAERIVVPARRCEVRAARADGMEVDPVQPGRQAVDLDVDMHPASAILGQLRPADLRTGGI